MIALSERILLGLICLSAVFGQDLEVTVWPCHPSSNSPFPILSFTSTDLVHVNQQLSLVHSPLNNRVSLVWQNKPSIPVTLWSTSSQDSNNIVQHIRLRWSRSRGQLFLLYSPDNGKSQSKSYVQKDVVILKEVADFLDSGFLQVKTLTSSTSCWTLKRLVNPDSWKLDIHESLIRNPACSSVCPIKTMSMKNPDTDPSDLVLRRSRRADDGTCSNTCKNKADCINGICYCKKVDGIFYFGDACENRVNQCTQILASLNMTELPVCIHGNCAELNVKPYINCTCTLGYEGIRCNEDINECKDSPCQNGAACNDLIGYYTCNCTTGFNGSNCENNIDDCVPTNICQNNGTCADGINNYTCNCAGTGFKGKNCEIPTDECDPDPCKNGGNCTDAHKNYTCSCYPGYSDYNCSTDINECQLNPCKFNSPCLQLSDESLYSSTAVMEVFKKTFSHASAAGYVCDCVAGTNGPNCTNNIDDCTPNPCSNSGVCTDLVNNFTCACTTGWDGWTCLHDFDDCASDPCLYGGNCTDKFNGFTCVCADGYSGPTCAVDTDDCAVTPCLNGGACTDGRNDFSCACVLPWGGKTCSVGLTGCSGTNPCLQQATCVPILINETKQDFYCQCPKGFGGKICDKNTYISFAGNDLDLTYTGVFVLTQISTSFITSVSNAVILAVSLSSTRFVALNIANKGLELRISDAKSWTLTKSILPADSVTANVNHMVTLDWSLNAHLKVVVKVTLSSTLSSVPMVIETNLKEGLTSWTVALGKLPGAFPASAAQANEMIQFRGCLRDVYVNKIYNILPGEPGVTSSNSQISGSCPRSTQCSLTSCNIGSSQGIGCLDLWNDYKCVCNRKMYGKDCQHNVTAFTLGSGDPIPLSFLEVADAEMTTLVKNHLIKNFNISFFLTTRSSNAVLFYVGTDKGALTNNFISGEIKDGFLQVRLTNSSQVKGQLYNFNSAWKLNIGETIFVSVAISPPDKKLVVQLKPPSPRPLNSNISTSLNWNWAGQTLPDVVFVGGYRNIQPALTRRRRSTSSVIPRAAFTNGTRGIKAVIEDPELSGYKLLVSDQSKYDQQLVLNMNKAEIVVGVANDPVCNASANLCANSGNCSDVFFNSYKCTCSSEFTGVNCTDINYCSKPTSTCPAGFTCNNLPTDYDCVSPVTFNGVSNQAQYNPSDTTNRQFNNITFKVRTRATSGTLISVAMTTVPASRLTVTLTAKGRILATFENPAKSLETLSSVSDALWHTVKIDFSPEFMITLNGVRGTGTSGGPLQTVSTVSVGSDNAKGSLFKGCLDNIHLGNVLLPFYPPSSVANSNFKFNLDEANSQLGTLGCTGDNVCTPNPCLNGGNCKDAFNNYTCACPQGYVGAHCQYPTCAALDCKNGARCAIKCPNGETTCDTSNNPHACYCTSGFVGNTCYAQDPCVSGSKPVCQNGGTCSVNLDDSKGTASFACECSGQFKGTTCSDPTVATANTPLIIGLVVGILLLIIIIVIVVVLVVCREKRAQHGVYNPHDQENKGAHVKMHGVMKRPPEERLI